jgi:L,D-transpeptidase YbiS
MIFVDIKRQVLIHKHQVYPISTAENGIGSQVNSFKTPLGGHEISDIIGLDQPIYTQFVSREPVGIVPPNQWHTLQGKDLILSRIIRLQGLEPGINQGPGVDSYERYIYIHGTSEEDLIGMPRSKGCIRMLNKDIINLSHQVQCGDQINIQTSVNDPELLSLIESSLTQT